MVILGEPWCTVIITYSDGYLYLEIFSAWDRLGVYVNKQWLLRNNHQLLRLAKYDLCWRWIPWPPWGIHLYRRTKSCLCRTVWTDLSVAVQPHRHNGATWSVDLVRTPTKHAQTVFKHWSSFFGGSCRGTLVVLLLACCPKVLGGGTCHSMNAGWVVRILRGGGGSQALPSFEHLALTGGRNTRTLFSHSYIWSHSRATV